MGQIKLSIALVIVVVMAMAMATLIGLTEPLFAKASGSVKPQTSVAASTSRYVIVIAATAKSASAQPPTPL